MKSRGPVLFLAVAIVVAFAAPALAILPVHVVDSTGDGADDNPGNGICHTAAGTCTLRAAIQESNAGPGGAIHFAVTGAGCAGAPAVCTIQPAADLPLIVKQVVIDGYTQPGASANTNGPSQGTNAVIMIELDGTHTSGAYGAGGLVFRSGSENSVVMGLAINRCPGSGIELSNVGPVTVEGCFIGTDPGGTIAHGNSDGIHISNGSNYVVGGATAAARNLLSGNAGAAWDLDVAFVNSNSGHVVSGNLIGTNAAGTAALPNDTGIRIGARGSNSTFGGTTPAARNVISGNTHAGINLSSGLGAGLVTGNLIQGNYVGVDVTGSQGLGNGTYGIAVFDLDNTIGGTAAGAGNVISGNGDNGIHLFSADNAVVAGNRIGTDAAGTVPIGNRGSGVNIVANNVHVGGTVAGAGNLIANNGVPSAPTGGIVVFGNVAGNTFQGNSMFSNIGSAGGLGIDLSANGTMADGVTPNDLTDADASANDRQNFPIITSVTVASGTTRIQGLLQSKPSTSYRVEFFSADACLPRPQGFVQGKTFLGFTTVATLGSGDFPIDSVLPLAVASNERVTATATDTGTGSTSEFSQRTVLSVSPKGGASAGGATITINGMQFQPGATTVMVGGAAATNVTYVSQYQLTATAPAQTPGLVYDILVTNPAPSPLSGLLPAGWVADFLDVPPGNGFEPFVDKLVGNSITAGCQSGNYCPASPVTRAQMAVFMLRSKYGVCYLPPPATGTVFTDVPIGSFAAAYVEALAAAQVTGGCGGGLYCPSSSVTRAQMSVFLLRTLEGPTYLPPACTTATFLDVPCSNGFSRWIKELVVRGITAGCGSGNFCPNDPVNRGQMAVFLVTTFALP